MYTCFGIPNFDPKPYLEDHLVNCDYFMFMGDICFPHSENINVDFGESESLQTD